MEILILILCLCIAVMLAAAVAMLAAVLKRTGPDGLRDEISAQLRAGREEQANSLAALGSQALESSKLAGEEVRRMSETVDRRLESLQKSNEEKLDKMRETVDEKLQRTLESRLEASFSQVGKQLSEVGQGLGEMKALAEDARSLKNALVNVKSRGTYGEVRCGKLLEDTLAPGQYDTNVNIKGNNIVEFVVKLPGQGDETVLLPIDSKFPIEDYNRLLDAEDKTSIEAARKALRAKILVFAKDIHDKYIEPPKTTGFALMFLPTEGLYAEVVRDAALFEELRDKYQVTPVGMTTLSAFLSALQVGFKTLAIEKRSQDVIAVLAGVKSEISKFGGMLEKARKHVQSADQALDTLSGTRLRAIDRKLRSIEALPGAETEEEDEL